MDHWMLRAVKWARNPPSGKMVKFVIALVLFCVLLYWVDRLFELPDWMQMERVRKPRY